MYMYQTRPKLWLGQVVSNKSLYLHVLKNPLRIQINIKWYFNFVFNISTNEVHGDINITARRRFLLRSTKYGWTSPNIKEKPNEYRPTFLVNKEY